MAVKITRRYVASAQNGGTNNENNDHRRFSRVTQNGAEICCWTLHHRFADAQIYMLVQNNPMLRFPFIQCDEGLLH